MKKIGFYVLGKKGYVGLTGFVSHFGRDLVAFVIGSRDIAVENDWHCEIRQFCEENGILFFSRHDASEKSLPVSTWNFVIAWRWMIDDASKLIVFHDSLLPKYRGFAPLVNMLVDGAEEIGVTALFASNEYDKGDIIYQAKKNISYPIKILDAIDAITPLYADLVIKTAEDIISNCVLNREPQNEADASYSLWRDQKDYYIEWEEDSSRIKRFIDSVGAPYRGATTMLNGAKIHIYESIEVKDVVVENRAKGIGKIIFFHDRHPVVVCGKGLLKLIDLRSEDGMDLVGSIPFRSRFESIK